jgi:hypothetical protein
MFQREREREVEIYISGIESENQREGDMQRQR